MTIDTRLISSIGKGVLVFAAVAPDDTQKEVEAMASKVLKLKLWPDERGGTVWNHAMQICGTETLTPLTSVETQRTRHKRGSFMWCVRAAAFLDLSYDFLTSPTVSQFTLLASTKKGSKPDFHGAAGGEKAKELYDHFFKRVQELYDSEKVKNGVFQAMMQVELVNDGPVGVNYRSDDGAVNSNTKILVIINDRY